MIGWAVFLVLAVAGMKSWVDSRMSDSPISAAPTPAVSADPAAAPAPAPAPAPASPVPAGGGGSGAEGEVWHCNKCNRDWAGWRLCCWVGTTRVK